MVRRIAVVIDPWELPFNGAVVSTRRFVGVLEEAGYEFQLLALQGPELKARGSSGYQKLSIPGFNRIINSMRAPLARPDRALIRRQLKDCDLLHVQYPFFLAYAAIAEARNMGIPVICSFHVQPENILQNIRLPSRWLSRQLYRLFIRFIYGRADRVVAPSSFAAELLIENGVEAPITVVSNGIPDRYFGIKRAPARKGIRILSVGRLAHEKQQETLLRAVSLSENAKRIQVVLAGVGPREKYLNKLARSLGVTADIGWVDDADLLALYGSADLFVHAGTIELEGMSVLEAMAAGNAVVVSNSKDSACATLLDNALAQFEKNNPVDLAEKIDYWLADDQRRVAEGSANREFARSLSHASAVAALTSVYDELATPVADSMLATQLNGTF